MTHLTFRIDNVGSTKMKARFTIHHAVRFPNLMRDVAQERKVYRAKSAFLARLLAPSVVSKFGINGAAQNFGADLTELLDLVGEGNDLRWAHKCEIQRVEEENYPFPAILGQGDLLEILPNQGFRFEIRSR